MGQAVKEKPNYRLKCKCEAKDDWITFDYTFNAVNDDEARTLALSYIEERKQKEKQAAENERRNVEVWFKPLSLCKLNYVIKEVIEETSIPLRGGTLERLASGQPVELSELGSNL